MGHTVRNFGFATAVVVSHNAPDVEGGKAIQYLNTDEAKECAEWGPDLVILGPFGKHDALGQYPPPPGGARYDEPATFTEEQFYSELKGMVEWAQGTQSARAPTAAAAARLHPHRRTHALSLSSVLCGGTGLGRGPTDRATRHGYAQGWARRLHWRPQSRSHSAPARYTI